MSTRKDQCFEMRSSAPMDRCRFHESQKVLLDLHGYVLDLQPLRVRGKNDLQIFNSVQNMLRHLGSFITAPVQK